VIIENGIAQFDESKNRRRCKLTGTDFLKGAKESDTSALLLQSSNSKVIEVEIEQCKSANHRHSYWTEEGRGKESERERERRSIDTLHE
jgi:hypothetical protein